MHILPYLTTTAEKYGKKQHTTNEAVNKLCFLHLSFTLSKSYSTASIIVLLLIFYIMNIS